MEWILNNVSELKQRAYLARYNLKIVIFLFAQLTVNIIFRFLVKLDIPPEISADQDVAQLYEQYEELIEQFKAVHKVHSFNKYFEIF